MVDPLHFENKVTILDRIIVRSYLTLLDNNEAFKRRLIINYNYFFSPIRLASHFQISLRILTICLTAWQVSRYVDYRSRIL